MKHYSFPHIHAMHKYCILFTALLLIFTSASRAQTIYTDDDLLNTGTSYYNNNNYREAQVYLFAYVQRNTNTYQNDSQFKSNIDAALTYAGRHSDQGGARATFMKHFQRDAQGHIIQPPAEIKPAINASPAPVSNMSLNSGVYDCDDGSLYYVTVINNEVWCFGRSSDNNWTNVIHGFISGDEIAANWASVPTNSKNSGTITLKIDNNSVFHVANQTGGFAGQSWKQSFQKSRKKTGNNG